MTKPAPKHKTLSKLLTQSKPSSRRISKHDESRSASKTTTYLLKNAKNTDIAKSSAPLIQCPVFTVPSSLQTTVHGPPLSEGIAHLISVDPRFKILAETNKCPLFAEYDRQITPFPDIVRGILAQQVSGAAARSILNKFVRLFSSDSDTFINNSAILAQVEETREIPTLEKLRNFFPTPEMLVYLFERQSMFLD